MNAIYAREFLRLYRHLGFPADMALNSSDLDGSDSHEQSPMHFSLDSFTKHATKEQTSPFLQLPNDLFKCVLDYLDRDAAWSLKRSCKGMSTSQAVDELLYRYPLQLADVKDLRLVDWKYRPSGMLRWNNFQASISDKNRNYVQKVAMSHWSSIEDFKWIEENLPALTSLDLSAIKDFVWTPEETWTWKDLVDTCPKLFARLEELEVSNWADYTAHSRIEYSYSYNDYRFKQPFRMSRRRIGGSVAKMVFPYCTKLRTLAIRDRYSGFHTWNEWEVHQRVCCLADGISKYCPPTLTKLCVHDFAPYRSLFAADLPKWSNITHVEIDLYTWMEDSRDRDVIGPIPYRIQQGHHHRDEEEAFDDKTYDSCERNHIELGSKVVQGAGASFEDLLKSLRHIISKYPSVHIKPTADCRDITLHPFHLVKVSRRRPGGPQQNAQPDPVTNDHIQEALGWLADKCGWKPILAWDSMMCDVFPANLEPSRSFCQKEEILARIRTMMSTLRSGGIPIRISIGDRANNCPSSGLDGSIYFGDYKTFVGEGDSRRELLAPTQACFSLAGVAHLVDELTIQYPGDVPGVQGWFRSASRGPTKAEEALLARELKGWRRFWHRYARLFTNLKKLTANVPAEIYNEWGKCEGLRELLGDKRWEMLEIEEKGTDFGFFGSYFPFSASRHATRRRSRMNFVQRVFFRQDTSPLNITPLHPELSVQELEDREITDAELEVGTEFAAHRFFPVKPEMKGKRKVESEAEDKQPASKKSKVKSD